MKSTRAFVALFVALALLLALALPFAVPTAKASDPAPSTVSYYQNYTFLNKVGVTTTQTSADGLGMVEYGTADCYVNVIAGVSPFTLTVVMWDSPDLTGWRTAYSFAATSSAGVTFTRTAVYGYYQRFVATVGNTNPITYTVKCVAKDN